MSFTVLMSVYAKEQPDYFNQAFLSIWDQQTLKPDQIVLVKDGPLTAELDAEIQRWQETLGEVLTVVELPENVGLGAALNEGLKACKHELVARMDTDDVSLPSRFEKQVAFMQANSDIAASSAQIEEWNTALTQKLDQRTLPTEPAAVARFAKRRSPLSQMPAAGVGRTAWRIGSKWITRYPEVAPGPHFRRTLWSDRIRTADAVAIRHGNR